MPRAPGGRWLGLAAALAAGWRWNGALLALPGIGPWTAVLRGAAHGRPATSWLPADLGVRHALAGSACTTARRRWRPYRAYAVVHLWSTLSG